MSKSQLEKRKSNACVGEGVDDDAMGGPAKKPRKRIQPRSFVWELFRKIGNPDETECLNCGKMVSYTGRNTQGMISHLKTKHQITEASYNEKKEEEVVANKQNENDGVDDLLEAEEEDERNQEELTKSEMDKLVHGN
jgi:hypothetical protein